MKEKNFLFFQKVSKRKNQNSTKFQETLAQPLTKNIYRYFIYELHAELASQGNLK